MAIRILLTGGTFDKEYDELSGSLYFKETHLPEMLALARNRVAVEVETLMLIDSLEMTDAQRQSIIARILQAEENQIIVTHGTDTMVQTAQKIAAEVQNKTIIVMGAMVPYKFGSSDGLFNLGAAIAFVQTLPAGVYICMNGRYFGPDNCYKDKELGEFKELQRGE